MDRLTAYIISTRTDLKVTHAGPTAEGKYVGWILIDDDTWHPLVNSQPVYDSPEAAEKAMRDLVDEIRKAVQEETGGRHPVDHVFSVVGRPGEADVVKSIVSQAQEMKERPK